MTVEGGKAVVEGLLLVVDIVLVVVCSVLHFIRKPDVRFEQELEYYPLLYGSLTLILFYFAGFITNLFHYSRHESQQMPQRSGRTKVIKRLLVFLPASYPLMWSYRRWSNPDSLTLKCWTASLRLFYCSVGSLVQGVFQSFVLIRLWWNVDNPEEKLIALIVSTIFFSIHAVIGVCWYIWMSFYDETHDYLSKIDFSWIFFVLLLNMCGRVVAMAIVMGTLGWYWLVLAVGAPFLVNYAAYTYVIHNTKKTCENFRPFIFVAPMALLSSITVSDRRVLTILTTLAWLACSLPQIITYHEEQVHWLVWGVPAGAQVVALTAMMFKWSVFHIAFERFTRLARFNQWTVVTTQEAPSK